jgi:ParB-like chromosome segregation protein Spo0J
VDEIKYRVRVTPPVEREAKIRLSREASNQVRDFYEFRNNKTSLKVVRIEIDLPIYRTENFRTFTDQKEYVKREQKPADFFQSGQENETVQQLQHNILTALARTGRSESIAPVIDVLRKERQREPLLITHRGVIVNGNRRLAAMRELFADNSETNSTFSHVDCMVLPEDATPPDIVDIEASLQAKPETKLDYDWIGDAELIKKLSDYGRTPLEIARQLNRKEKEVRNSLLALSEADLYLKDWAEAEGEYSRVRDAEQLFKDLPAMLQGKDAKLQEASRVIAWSLYDKKEQLGGRLYSFNVAFGKRAADVLDRVATDLGISLDSQPREQTDNVFEVAIEDEEAEVSYDSLLTLLRDPERREETTDTLIEVSRSVIELERGDKSAGASLKAVTQAHAKLAEVDLSKAAPSTYDSIGKQLHAIAEKASDLQSKLVEYQSGGAESSGT